MYIFFLRASGTSVHLMKTYMLRVMFAAMCGSVGASCSERVSTVRCGQTGAVYSDETFDLSSQVTHILLSARVKKEKKKKKA